MRRLDDGVRLEQAAGAMRCLDLLVALVLDGADEFELQHGDRSFG
jgi:hypothetical protein